VRVLSREANTKFSRVAADEQHLHIRPVLKQAEQRGFEQRGDERPNVPKWPMSESRATV